jgi:hypothetical protein
VTLAGFQDQCHKPLDQLSKKSTTTTVVSIVGFVGTNPNGCACIIPMPYRISDDKAVCDEISNKNKTPNHSDSISLRIRESILPP